MYKHVEEEFRQVVAVVNLTLPDAACLGVRGVT